jgi:hypothetical protein
VACDPGWLDEDTPPFVARLAPGRYLVVLSIAHFPSGDRRVAFATLRVQDRGPVRSEIAARMGYDTHSTIVCFTTDFAVLGDEG